MTCSNWKQYLAWGWWCIPLRQKEVRGSLWVTGQSDVQTQSQPSQSYWVRPYFKKQNKQQEKWFLSSDIEVEIHLWHIAGCSFAPSVRWQNRQLSNCYQIHEDNDPILFIPAKHKPKHSTRESKGFLVWETHGLPDSQLNTSYLYNPCPIVSSVLQVLSPGQFLTHPWVPPNVKSCYLLMSYSSYATHVPHSRSCSSQQCSVAQQRL